MYVAPNNALYDDFKKVDTVKEAVARRFFDTRPLYWALLYHANIRSESMFRSIEGSRYLWELYKIIDKTPQMVVEKSVQCGLSELFIIQSHIEAGERGLSVMYVLPKYELRNRFVNNRIYKIHHRLPHYSRLVAEAETKVHRTSLMHFGSGTLAYVGSNVRDEFIEIPIDSAFVDEKDRCNLAHLNLLPDRFEASPYQFQREISNPSTEGFGIDERYLESSQGVWMIKCPHCGKWFCPDFFQHVVQEVSPNVFIPRDKDADRDPLASSEISLVHDCGKPVDRLMKGAWVHAYPDRSWKGFRVSKLVARLSPKGSLRSLYYNWLKAVGNSLKTQIFYNSDLGLPFNDKGARITRTMLNDCRRNYPYPPKRVAPTNRRFLGVDVGESLHLVMRERVRVNDRIELRLIGTWVLPGFSQLVRIMREWKPDRVVIDALPEIHKIMDLKLDFGNVWSSKFQESATSLSKNDPKRELSMNRTALLDFVMQAYELQQYTLPLNAEFLNDGEFYKHLLASTRILEANEQHPEKSRFVWREGSKPDHFFLADAYCMQANMIMPEHGIFEFFDEQSAMNDYTKLRDATGAALDKETRRDIADHLRITPEIALQNIREQTKPKPVTPVVDDERIRDSIEFMMHSNGYVDLILTARMANEHEDDVRRVLKTLRYKESRIRGQWVK